MSPTSRTVPLIGVLLLLILSRLPFLSAGFGTDYDAWLLIEASRDLRDSGTYTLSRPPGYPLLEGTFALVPNITPRVANGLSALMSLIAALLTYGLLKNSGRSGALAMACAFAFTPVIWIASTSSIDYLWAWMFVLSSWSCSTRSKPVLAGLLLALATASRLTSVLMVAPLGWLISRRGSRRDLRSFVVCFTLGSVACYLPVLQNYSLGSLLPEYSGPQDLQWILEKGTLGVFGSLGVVVLALALLASAVREPVAPSEELQITEKIRRPAVICIYMYVLLFMALPYESGYLVPVAGALPLYLGTRLGARQSWLFAVGLMLSALISWNGPGPVVKDLQARERELVLIEHATEALQGRTDPTLLLCGDLYSKLRYSLRDRPLEHVTLRMGIQDLDQLPKLRRRHGEVLFVNSVDPWHKANRGYSLWEIARPLLPMDWEQPQQQAP